MSTMKKLQVTAQLIIFSMLSPTVFASDGVLEINHTCATQLGCFSGDTVGYPITIDGTAGRSYRLTSDLIVPNISTIGIEVITSSISIDLNGFEIVRSGCEGATTDCTATGLIIGGAGVLALNTYHGVSVKNGSITGMGYGVKLEGPQSVVKDLRVRWNLFNGIKVGRYAIVSDNTAYANGETGIYASTGAVISGNSSSTNGEDGIRAGYSSTISANTATFNGVKDIPLKNYGITAFQGCNVQNNAVSGNVGHGMSLKGSSGYRDNVITENKDGTVLGASAVNLGGNLCETNDTCP